MSGELAKFLGWFDRHEGRPYLWGGRGLVRWTPEGMAASPYEGWDCWGAVADAWLASGGPDRRLWNTDAAWAQLEGVATPRPGDLVFYAARMPKSPNDVEHVEVVTGEGPGAGTWRTIGAAGGGSTTDTLDEALASGARIRRRPSHLNRLRFCGFRTLGLR